MIRVIGILLSLFELLGSIFLAYHARHNFAWLVALCCAAALSAFGFVLRLRERSIAAEIADAEDKLIKRVLRRIAKSMPDMVLFASETQRAIEKRLVEGGIVRDVVRDELVKPGTTSSIVKREVEAVERKLNEAMTRIARTVVGEALSKHAPRNCGCPMLQLHAENCETKPISTGEANCSRENGCGPEGAATTKGE